MTTWRENREARVLAAIERRGLLVSPHLEHSVRVTGRGVDVIARELADLDPAHDLRPVNTYDRDVAARAGGVQQ